MSLGMPDKSERGVERWLRVNNYHATGNNVINWMGSSNYLESEDSLYPSMPTRRICSADAGVYVLFLSVLLRCTLYQPCPFLFDSHWLLDHQATLYCFIMAEEQTLPLLRGSITLSAALKEEEDMLLELSYPEK